MRPTAATGCNRLEAILSLEGTRVSAITIQKLLNENGLGTRIERWLALEEANAGRAIDITPEQAAFLEKLNPCFRAPRRSTAPGELLSADTFFVGSLKGVGKVYLHAVVETPTAPITKRQKHLIAELNHALHAKRSEKLTEDERQLAFEDLSIALAEVEAEKKTRAVKAGDGATGPAPKRSIGNLPAALPRIEEVIEPASLICPCGCGVMHRIGEDRRDWLDIIPAQLRVIVTARPKYACRTCTDGVTQAFAPSHLIMGARDVLRQRRCNAGRS